MIYNLDKCDKMIALVGYASSSFLLKILEMYPDLNLELYIGMAKEGINESDHTHYKSLSQHFNVKVYYQIRPINEKQHTHLKAYTFFSKDKAETYVGSANFSENGFIYNRELLTKIDDDFESERVAQREASILCTDPAVDNNIKFYVNKKDRKDSEQDSLISGSLMMTEEENNQNTQEKVKSKISLKDFYHRQNIIYLDTFEVTIAFNRKFNSAWFRRGINEKLHGNRSYLGHSPQDKLHNLFPEDKILKFFTDDGLELTAEMSGPYNRYLYLVKEDWYDYIVNRIGIHYGVPIANEDLQLIGQDKLKFTRLNEDEYFMEIKE